MKKVILTYGISFACSLASSASFLCSSAQHMQDDLPSTVGVKPSPDLIVKVISSEIERHPKAWTLDGAVKPKWNYTQGLELMAMTDAADHIESNIQGPFHAYIYNYVSTYSDTLVREDGTILGHKIENHSLDEINSGKILYRLWQRTGLRKYRMAMDVLRTQLQESPRVAEGGFWHKQRYPHQMWLDGLYMGAPYYAEYASRFETGKTQENSFCDIWQQFDICFRHTWCSNCKLLHHGWDSSHQQKWSDPLTGRSQHAWGRADGWYLMALVDCADWMPTNYRDSLAQQLQLISNTLLTLQDKQNGCWMQVLDETGREGNYFEMSASSMIAYAFMKGYRMGMLKKKFQKAGKRALEGICKYFVSTDTQGQVTLHNICQVAGLSDPDRDGSFEYYCSTARKDNDPKGIGPFIKALIEYDLIIKKK